MDSRDVGTVLCVAAAQAAAWFGRWDVFGAALVIWLALVLTS